MPIRPKMAHFSLAKLESRQEARLWADIFRFTEQQLGIPQGFIRVMVAIDTISAASEMEEILFELREYVTALECSPVSYLASFVRSFRAHGESLLPQRSDISMNQPFLQAYRELLVHTCSSIRVHAVSSDLQQFRMQGDVRSDEREQARASLEIQHEIELGFDGICLSDPGLIPVALSTFTQTTRRHRSTRSAVGKCHVTARDLISPSVGRITMTALKENVESALVYLEAWLAGRGSALSVTGLKSMASAELCRAQLWQWLRHSARLTGGHRVSRYVIECLIRDSLASVETRVGERSLLLPDSLLRRRFCLVAARMILTPLWRFVPTPISADLPQHNCSYDYFAGSVSLPADAVTYFVRAMVGRIGRPTNSHQVDCAPNWLHILLTSAAPVSSHKAGIERGDRQMDIKRAKSHYIYRFGQAEAEGDGSMREELGGKGAALAEMTKLGLPVPPGFTISTGACRFYLEHGAMPESLEEELKNALGWLELEQAQRLGSQKDPLLLSVRSGAPISMPGMMDTILNVGINDANLGGLAVKHRSSAFALDSYRRLLQMFGSVVLQIPKQAFDQAAEDASTGCEEATLRRTIASFQRVIKDASGRPFPMDPHAQLRQAVEAVFQSWNNERARHYRRIHNTLKIPALR